MGQLGLGAESTKPVLWSLFTTAGEVTTVRRA